MRRTGKSHPEAEWQIKIKTIGLKLSNKHRNQLLIVLSRLRACRYVFCLAFVDHRQLLDRIWLDLEGKDFQLCHQHIAHHKEQITGKLKEENNFKICVKVFDMKPRVLGYCFINQLLSHVVIILPLEWKHSKLWHAFADRGDFSYKPVIVHIQNITRSWEVCSSKPYSFLLYFFYKEAVSCCVYAN